MMKKIFKDLEKKLNNLSIFLGNIIKIDYIFYFLCGIFLLVFSYEIVIFIVNSQFYSFSKFSLFFFLICCLYLIIKSYSNDNLNSSLKVILEKYGNFFLSFGFVIYILINIIFFKGSIDGLFLFSTFILFVFYAILRFFGLKIEYNFLKSSVKKEDIFSFYTIYIVLFLFLFTFIFSIDFLPEYRALLVLFGFIISSIAYIFIFNNEYFMTKRNSLLSRKNRHTLKKVKIGIAFLVLFLIFGVSAFYYFGGFKYFSTPTPNNNITQNDIEDAINNTLNDSLDNVITSTGEVVNSGSTFTGEIIATGSTFTGVVDNTGIISSQTTNTGITNGIKTDEKYIRIGDYYNFTRFIGIGNFGEDVKKVHQILKNEGYYFGDINSNFDENTSKALENFIYDKTKRVGKYSQLGPKTMEVFKNIEIKVKE